MISIVGISSSPSPELAVVALVNFSIALLSNVKGLSAVSDELYFGLRKAKSIQRDAPIVSRFLSTKYHGGTAPVDARKRTLS